MNINKLLSTLYYIAMGLVFFGVLMQLASVPNALIVFGTGAFFMFGIRLYNRIIGKPENRRIFTILLVSASFLLMAAWAIYTNRGYWVLFIFITATLDAYASFRRIRG